jgi:hypothetical protein
MDLRKYIQQLCWWIAILSIATAFFAYQAILSPVHGKLGYGMFGIGTGLGCALFVYRWIKWAWPLYTKKVIFNKKFTVAVPLNYQVHLEVNSTHEGYIYIFFENTSPDMLRGAIASAPEAGVTQASMIRLTEAEPLNNPFIPREKKYWPRSTGTSYYPLSMPFKMPNAVKALSINFDLQWNFEDTYLEKYLPKDRKLAVEITVIEMNSPRQL